ncbi:MAG: OmpA family protein [Bacteroidota bacterium]
MKYLLLSISVILYTETLGQLTDFKEVWKDYDYKAESLYNQGLFEAAVAKYQVTLEDNPDDKQALLGIAKCYKVLGKYELSRAHYSVLDAIEGLDSLENIQDYADVLLSSGNVNKALVYYRKALLIDSENQVIRNRIAGIVNWDELFKDEKYIKVEPASFNTEYNEFAFREYNDGVSYISAREQELIIHRNYLRGDECLTDVYLADDAKAKPREFELLTLKGYKSRNDGPLSQYKDLVVISRSMPSRSDKISTLGLYFYKEDQSGALKEEYEFPFNSPTYNVTHPAFNISGDTLFFVSDMPGGMGGLDVYYSVFRNNVWTMPKNSGALVNTYRNEIFPYSDNGILYFSSDGHHGLGGYDTYKLTTIENEKTVVNLGYPVNSSWDDFSIYIKNDRGFIASNDPKGKGGDDLYEFVLLPIPIKIDSVDLSFIALDTLNDHVLDSVLITVSGVENTTQLISDKDGKANINVVPGTYRVHAGKEPYIHHPLTIDAEAGESMSYKLWMDPPVKMHVVSADSIMFGLGEYTLLESAKSELDEIVKTLQEYPELTLEVSAHTDSRGSHEYNLWLSKKRAESASLYIISQGIEEQRVIQKGLGETELLNNCRDGVTCSEEFHAVNRRIEFDFHRE